MDIGFFGDVSFVVGFGMIAILFISITPVAIRAANSINSQTKGPLLACAINFNPKIFPAKLLHITCKGFLRRSTGHIKVLSLWMRKEMYNVRHYLFP